MVPTRAGYLAVTDRQELVPGFDQEALSRACVWMIGAGGIGSKIGEGVIRKGVGTMCICDPDFVEITNLNRQLYFRRDIGRRKGPRLARNLARHATGRTLIRGWGLSFQETVAMGLDPNPQLVVCGVDNGDTRTEVSRHFRLRGIPVVFAAIDYLAENGYVFVREPGRACFGCAFPRSYRGRKAPCRTAAANDVLQVVAGFVLYAIDTLLMARKRSWNYRHTHLAGFVPSRALLVEKRADCPLCGGDRAQGEHP
jgi:molybdopterin/thiamine biosynthesis adenylyltransferase